MKTSNYFFLFVVFLLVSINVFATHNRAGQITYRWIGTDPQQLLYEVTITTFTKTSSIQADRPTLDSVYWGDSTPPAVFVRNTFVDLPNDIRKNTYINTHTYAGSGVFIIHFTDPNRNADVMNIPHSVSVPFYLESWLVINPFLGLNNSIVTTYDPIDQGCVKRIFIHNPGVYDVDGDSISYELIECGGTGGAPIPGYTYPSALHSFTLDNLGYLTWDWPTAQGEYNVAFEIKEWRHGVFIGLVRRDMQILIGDCDNFPPIITVINDTCVLAGDTLKFLVSASDPDFHRVILTASGGLFDASLVADPATFTDSITNASTVYSKFSWITKCHHVRMQPYLAQFKAIDIPPAGVPALVDLKGTSIRVIAPAPTGLTTSPNGSAIDLKWLTPLCSDVLHYNIYRRTGMYPGTIQCPCETGVPSYTGYTLIGTSNGQDTTFTDNNSGQGLTIGIQYCYMVTAQYQNGSESCASIQSCTTLKKDAPVITNADVRITDMINGSVYVAWSKPTELDTALYPGPYKYMLYHSPDFFGGAFSWIATFDSLIDTTYIDTINLDTKTHPWSYKVELYYTVPSTLQDSLKGQTANASTIFLSIAPTDNRLNLSWEEHVPWTNTRYDIFKRNLALTYDSIASVNVPFYSDSGLANGDTFCYFIRSVGSYSFSGFVDPIINRSQEVCESPFDNVHPCPPQLTVNSDCNNNENMLVWTNPNNSCADDVLKYYIYFGQTETGNFELIDSIVQPNSPTDTTYEHKGLSRISGCYKVTAIDSVGNETITPLVVCVDTCRQYVLPSVFTPNGDGNNDLFHPCDSTTSIDFQAKNCPPYKNVESVDMKIYNRWGAVVFETNDKDVNWDGTNKENKTDCSDGVYFYTCKVFFFSVKGEQSVNLHGTIQLIRN